MNVNGRPMRTIWLAEDGRSVEIIDQRLLPHELVITQLATRDDAATAIRDMAVRGAPLIGATAAYGMALAVADDASDARVELSVAVLGATRPTAVNLWWALDRMRIALLPLPPSQRHEAALTLARPAGRNPHALQCRLAGDGRLGHRAGAGLSRA
jgi:methylthioribose-1-phosphate isomerase